MAKLLSNYLIISILIETESARHYLSLLQENIKRMASNSANCKTWTITIVTAMLALTLSDESIIEYLQVLYIPVASFFFLDSYYLSIEQRFRKVHKNFVKVAKENGDISELIYAFNVDEYPWGRQFFYATTSISTWPFYLILGVIITLLIF